MNFGIGATAARLPGVTMFMGRMVTGTAFDDYASTLEEYELRSP
jgi:hypothetical protein